MLTYLSELNNAVRSNILIKRLLYIVINRIDMLFSVLRGENAVQFKEPAEDG